MKAAELAAAAAPQSPTGTLEQSAPPWPNLVLESLGDAATTLVQCLCSDRGARAALLAHADDCELQWRLLGNSSNGKGAAAKTPGLMAGSCSDAFFFLRHTMHSIFQWQ